MCGKHDFSFLTEIAIFRFWEGKCDFGYGQKNAISVLAETICFYANGKIRFSCFGGKQDFPVLAKNEFFGFSRKNSFYFGGKIRFSGFGRKMRFFLSFRGKMRFLLFAENEIFFLRENAIFCFCAK